MPVDREVIEVYMKIIGLEDAKQANKELEKLQKQMGHPLVIADLTKLTGDSRQVVAAAKEVRRELQSALIDVVKVDAGIKSLLGAASRRQVGSIQVNQPLGLPLHTTLSNPRMDAYTRGGFDKYLSGRLGGTELFPGARMRLEPHSNPNSYIAQMATKYGTSVKAVETAAAKILVSGTSANVRDLDRLQKYLRYAEFQDRRPLGRLSLRNINLSGVDPQMIPYLMSQLGTSLYGLTPRAMSAGTSYASPLSSIAKIPGGIGSYITYHPGMDIQQGRLQRHPVTGEFNLHAPEFHKPVQVGGIIRPYRLGGHEYDSPGQTFQRVSQSLQAMRKAHLVDTLVRVPEQIHPMLGALPANDYLSFMFGNSGSKLWSLTNYGQQAYDYMQFGDYPGYQRQDTRLGQRRLFDIGGGRLSHQDVTPKWMPPKSKTPSDAVYVKYAEELFELNPAMRDALLGVFHNTQNQVFGPQIAEQADVYAKSYMMANAYPQGLRLGQSLSDKSNVDRTRLLNAKGYPAFTLFNKNMMGNELIMSANPAIGNKYNMQSQMGREAHYNDLFSYLTGQYTRKGVGSQQEAAYYTGQTGQAILSGAYGPEEIVKLGEVLAEFSRTLSPHAAYSGQAVSWDPIVLALGGSQQLQAITVTVQQAIDQLAKRFDKLDADVMFEDYWRSQLTPTQKADRDDLRKRGRLRHITDAGDRELAEFNWEQRQRAIESSRAGYPLFGHPQSSGFIFDKDERDEVEGFKENKEKLNSPIFQPFPSTGKNSWIPPWLRRGVYSQELLSENITGPYSEEDTRLELRRQIYAKELALGSGSTQAAAIAGVVPEEHGQTPALRSDAGLSAEDARTQREADLQAIHGPGTAGPYAANKGASTPQSRRMTRLEQIIGLSKKVAKSKAFKMALPLMAGVGLSALMSLFGGPAGTMAGMGMLPFMMGAMREHSGPMDPSDWIKTVYRSRAGAPPEDEEARKTYYDDAKKAYTEAMHPESPAKDMMAEPGQGPYSSLPAGDIPAKGETTPHKRPAGRRIIEPRMLEGLETIKNVARIKISGFASFGDKDVKAYNEFIAKLQEIPGMNLSKVTGARYSTFGLTSVKRVGFSKMAEPGADASEYASRIGQLLDETTEAIDKQGSVAGKTASVMQKSADAKIRFITGSETGNINSTQITGVLKGQTDQILELEQSLRGMNGVMTTSVEHIEDMQGSAQSSSESILTFNGTVRETGGVVTDNVKSMIETRGEMDGQVKMTGKFSSALDMATARWQKFIGAGKDIKALSRGMLQLQMGFLGVYFSMMSVVGMLQQGIGAITNPLKDLNGMIESFAMSNAFAPEGALTGTDILKDYGVSIGDVVEGWKKMMWIGSIMNLSLGALGAKVFGDDATWAKIQKGMESLHSFLSDPDTIEHIKNIFKGMADLMPSLVSAIGGVLTILEKVVNICKTLDQWKMPEFMAGWIGEGPIKPGTGKKDEKGNIIPGTEEHEAPSFFQGVSVVALTSGLLLGLASIVALPFTLIKLIYGLVTWIAAKLGYGAAAAVGEEAAKKVAEKAAGQSTLETFGEGAAGAGIASKLPMQALPLMQYFQQLAIPIAQYAPIVPAMMQTPGFGTEEYMEQSDIRTQWEKSSFGQFGKEGNWGMGPFNSIIQSLANILTGKPESDIATQKAEEKKPTNITTNVTNVIYGDYVQSTDSKVADTVNNTLKSFIGGTGV